MRPLSSLAALALAFACSPPPGQPARAAAREPVSWRSLVGCYHGDGEHFAFDSIPALGVFTGYVEGGRSLRSSSPYDERYGRYWRVSSPDSVQLVYEAGTDGMVYHLAVRGDTLAGRVSVSTDIVLPGGRRRRDPPAMLVREACPPASTFSIAYPDSAALATLLSFVAALPKPESLSADPWRAVAPLRAWRQAHPAAAKDWSYRATLDRTFREAADAAARFARAEVAGTWRLEIARGDGPALVFFARTNPVPSATLELSDTAAPPMSATPGYRLPLTFALDSSALPAPGVHGNRPRAYGDQGPSNGVIEVRLPGAAPGDGTRRFAIFVQTLNFTSIFGDPAVHDLDDAWYLRRLRDQVPRDPGEAVIWPDGRATLSQRLEFGPGQVLALRGERISAETWACPPAGC